MMCFPSRQTVSTFLVLGILTLSILPKNSFAQTIDTITVNKNQIITDTSKNPFGIDTDYLVDDDHQRPTARPLKDALSETGAHFVRYGASELLWSVPPYDHAVPTLAL